MKRYNWMKRSRLFLGRTLVSKPSSDNMQCLSDIHAFPRKSSISFEPNQPTILNKEGSLGKER